MSGFTWAWVGWAVYFAVVEGLALTNSRRGGTLSEHIWAFVGSRYVANKPAAKVTGWVRLRRFLTLAFLAWLSAHFLTGGYF
jgi:hypothetical protein